MPSIHAIHKVALALSLDSGSLMTPPAMSAVATHEFSEMAEAGLSEYGDHLEKGGSEIMKEALQDVLIKYGEKTHTG